MVGHAATAGGDGDPGLTPQQWTVLAWVARGAGDKQIAAALGVSYRTVKNHLQEIYPRLPLGDASNKRVGTAVWYVTGGRRHHEEVS